MLVLRQKLIAAKVIFINILYKIARHRMTFNQVNLACVSKDR